jgi:predicted nucleotidyltransferase
MKDLHFIIEIIRKNADVLRNRFKVKSLAVFGSYARNEQAEGSDIDMLVEYSEPVSLFFLVDTELFLGDILGAKVDLVMKRSIRPEIRQSVLQEAVSI